MNLRRVLGILMIVGGIVLILTSNYISERVLEGKAQIASGQRKVDTADSVFGMSRATKPVGKAFTGSGQRRIDAGQREVDRYEQLAGQFRMGGYALIIVGLIVTLVPRRKRA